MSMKSVFSSLVLAYLRILAKLQLKKNNPLIIGITGTAGKTSCRNAVAAVLKPHFQIKVSYKANSETGIPLNILGLTAKDYSWIDWLRLIVLAPVKLLINWKQFNIYVAEMAIDSPFPPKNMGYLLKIIQPQIGIFLNAKPMHSLEFDQLVSAADEQERTKQITRLIAQEKGRLIAQLPKSGLAVLNQDDINVYSAKNQTQAKVCTFGRAGNADIQIKQHQVSLSGTSFKFELAKRTGVENKQSVNQTEGVLNFEHYLLPTHYAYTFAAAAAVGLAQDLSLNQCLTALQQNFELPPGRSSLIKGINDSFILDSSYNASAQPVIDALELINQIAPGRKLALLGDIRELGQESKPEHEATARTAADICQLVVLVGPLMKQHALPILQTANTRVRWFERADQAADFLKSQLQTDDLLLVKGSQNTLLLEIAVKELMAHPEKAEQLLCRRGKYWEQRRAKLLAAD